MKTTLFVVLFFLFACIFGCGDDNISNSSGQIGEKWRILYGFTNLSDSITVTVINNRVNFSLPTTDTISNPMSLYFTGSYNDSIINFNCAVTYLGATFNNTIRGTINGNFILGSIFLNNINIGSFHYLLHSTSVGLINSPAWRGAFMLRKL